MRSLPRPASPPSLRSPRAAGEGRKINVGRNKRQRIAPPSTVRCATLIAPYAYPDAHYAPRRIAVKSAIPGFAKHPMPDIRFDRFYRYDELTTLLHNYAEQ